MTFIARGRKEKTSDAAMSNIIRCARFAVSWCSLGAAEKALDEYLKENFKVSLKRACLFIILRSRYELIDDYVIITQPDEKLSDIARLITFGDGRMQGSRILKKALMADN